MAEKKVNIKLVALLALVGLIIAMVAAPWVFRVTSQLDCTKEYIFRKIFNRVFLVSEVLVFIAFWKKLGIVSELPATMVYFLSLDETRNQLRIVPSSRPTAIHTSPVPAR